jgi:hypothetical protein
MGATSQRSRHAEQDGQILIEFALVLPVFLLVVFGLLDVGRLVYTNSTISQAAREAARVGAAEAAWIGVSGDACVSDESQITPSRPGAHVCPVDVSAFKSHISDAVGRMTVTLGPITTVHVSCDEDPDSVPAGAWTETSGGNGCQDAAGRGDLFSVRIEYEYQTFTPIVSSFIQTVPLVGSATMIVN